MLNIGVFLTHVYDHRAVASYEQYQYGIDFFGALSKTMPFPERPYINNLFNGVRDLTKDVKTELVADAKGKAQCKTFVSTWLVKTLQTATVHDLLDEFVNIINGDPVMAARTKTALLKGYVAKDYTQFLTDVLIYENETYAPLLMAKPKSYRFYTPNDQGTGCRYKGVLTLDLAILSITDLPVLIHDSVMYGQMSYKRVENTMRLYTTFEKQIFIAVDKTTNLNEETRRIITENRVLLLAPNGNELFGWYWGKPKEA